jgi:high-affinity iron transporter
LKILPKFMFQISIVVFREIFEIALIIGILTAATKSISGRSKWIVGGLAGGIAGSLILTFFTDKISDSFSGMGQEIFNGTILFAAALMISWTVLWMQKHARSISGELKNLSNEVRQGEKPIYALFLVVFFSVLREGAEIVLFAYSYFISGTALQEIIFGLLIGALLGAGFGVALYFGILKVFGRYFFPITTWILVFLTAGITAQGAGLWVDAALIPALGNPIFDSSEILSQHGIFGKFLNIFFGYIEKPYGAQLIAYLLSLGFLVIALKACKSGLNGTKKK